MIQGLKKRELGRLLKLTGLLFVLSSVSVGLYANNHTPPVYNFLELPGEIGHMPAISGYTKGEYSFSQAQIFKINDAGIIAGSSYEAGGISKAMVFDINNPVFIQLPDRGSHAAAYGLDSLDHIVGWTAAPGQAPVATLWIRIDSNNWGQPQVLSLTNTNNGSNYIKSRAWDMNDNGIIVGSVAIQADTWLAAYWPDAASDPILIGNPTTGFQGEAFAINNSNRITGVQGVNVNTSTNYAFYWDVGSGSTVGTVPNISKEYEVLVYDQQTKMSSLVTSIYTGKTSWGGAGINSSGTIIGGSNYPSKFGNGVSIDSVTRPFAWSPVEPVTPLYDLFGNTSWALGINDAGYVVGVDAVPGINLWPGDNLTGRRPFVYRQETDASSGGIVWARYDISDQITPALTDFILYNGGSIDSVGRIVGLGGRLVNNTEEWHVYMLTPVVADLVVTQSVQQSTTSAKPSSLKPRTSHQQITTNNSAQLNFSVNNLGPEAEAHNVVVENIFASGLTVTTPTIEGAACSTETTQANETLVRCTFATVQLKTPVEASIQFQSDTNGSYEIRTYASSDVPDVLNQNNNTKINSFDVVASNTQQQPDPDPDPQDTNNPPVNNDTGTGNSSTTTESSSSTASGCSLGNNQNRDMSLLLALAFLICWRLFRSLGTIQTHRLAPYH